MKYTFKACLGRKSSPKKLLIKASLNVFLHFKKSAEHKLSRSRTIFLKKTLQNGSNYKKMENFFIWLKIFFFLLTSTDRLNCSTIKYSHLSLHIATNPVFVNILKFAKNMQFFIKNMPKIRVFRPFLTVWKIFFLDIHTHAWYNIK